MKQIGEKINEASVNSCISGMSRSFNVFLNAKATCLTADRYPVGVMGDPHFPPNPDKIAESSVAVRIAVMLTTGMNKHAIATELKISDSKVRTIMKSDECIRAMRDITNHEKDYAKARAAQRSGELIDECFRVLKQQLKKNNLQAVQLTLKASGVFEEFDKQLNNDAKLVVVMPGAQLPQQDVVDLAPSDHKRLIPMEEG